MSEKKTTKKKIGVLFSNKDNPFYNFMHEGIESYIKDVGADYETVFEQTSFSVEAQCKKLAELSTADLSGLIITPIDNPEVLEHLVPFYASNTPIITLNTDLPRANKLSFVGCDNYKCGRASGELMQLITGGKAEVAIITGSREVISHEQRIAGFKDYIKENSPKMSIEDIIECKNDDYTAYDMTHRLLLAHPTLTALYFTAGGVEGACKALDQMTVPRNISVVSFDVLNTTRPYLKKGIITASLVQNPKDQGRKAMEILDKYITEGKRPESDQYLFPISVMLKEMV